MNFVHSILKHCEYERDFSLEYWVFSIKCNKTHREDCFIKMLRFLVEFSKLFSVLEEDKFKMST